jgi:excisionase family DNA binding protein
MLNDNLLSMVSNGPHHTRFRNGDQMKRQMIPNTARSEAATSQERLRGLLPNDRLMTVGEVAEVLVLSVKSVTRRIKSGQIPAIRIAGVTRINPADLAALMPSPQAEDTSVVIQAHINQHVKG